MGKRKKKKKKFAAPIKYRLIDDSNRAFYFHTFAGMRAAKRLIAGKTRIEILDRGTWLTPAELFRRRQAQNRPSGSAS